MTPMKSHWAMARRFSSCCSRKTTLLRRIFHDRVVDAPEGVGLLFAEIGFDAADGEVHHGEAAGGGVALLTVDADVAEPAAVGFDEFFRLHEHAAGAAAGIVDAAFIGSEHLDEQSHDALRR